MATQTLELEQILGTGYEILGDPKEWREIFKQSGIEQVAGLNRGDFRSRSKSEKKKNSAVDIVNAADFVHNIRFRSQSHRPEDFPIEFTVCESNYKEGPIDPQTPIKEVQRIIAKVFAPTRTDTDGFKPVETNIGSFVDEKSGICYIPVCLKYTNRSSDTTTGLVLLLARGENNKTVHGLAFMAQAKTQ